jgi:hypothetical protein
MDGTEPKHPVHKFKISVVEVKDERECLPQVAIWKATTVSKTIRSVVHLGPMILTVNDCSAPGITPIQTPGGGWASHKWTVKIKAERAGTIRLQEGPAASDADGRAQAEAWIRQWIATIEAHLGADRQSCDVPEHGGKS